MRRMLCDKREGWERLIVDDGITYSFEMNEDGSVHHYWREGVYYALTQVEVLALEKATAEIFKMFEEAGDWIEALPKSRRTAFMRDKMRIPEFAHKAILHTWADEPACQSVYGRFDFHYAGPGTMPRAYEFNAQTPTGLVEAAWAQWQWRDQTKIGIDQWNSIWDRLVEAWKRNLAEIGKKLRYDGDWDASQKPTVHFAYSSGQTMGEDEITVSYLMDTCLAAGYNVRKVIVDDFKLGNDGRLYVPKEGVDPHKDTYTIGVDSEHLDICFMLYPWEWVWNEPWGQAIFADMNNVGKFDKDDVYVGGTVWFEAPYKMLWSNKAILPLLWQLFGNDPVRSQYLIPAWFKGEEPADLTDRVEKPIFAREGASIKVYRNGTLQTITAGDYNSDDPHDYIVQAYVPPPTFVDDHGQTVYTIVGSWVIDGEPAGMGVREDVGVVTTTNGFFAPHAIVDIQDSPVVGTITSTTQDAAPARLDLQDAPAPETTIQPAYAGFTAPRR